MSTSLTKQIPCYACGDFHRTYYGPYFWKATPADNSFWKGSRDGKRDGRRIAWNVWAIQECGALANTESVSHFEGDYHNAKENAEECVGLHNTALGKRLGLEIEPEGVRRKEPLKLITDKSAVQTSDAQGGLVKEEA